MKKGIAHVIVTILACVASVACDKTSPTPTDAPYIVGEDGNFRSIATALNAAPPGSVIEVRRGTYAERVIIEKPGMKLRAQSAVLDGTAGSLDGRGIGILISGVADVEISGFTVRNFERGIVLRNASNSTLRANEVHANNNKGASTAPPLAPGVDLFEGVVLLGSSNNQIVDNILRDNGHDGLMVTDGSRNNVVRGNRILNNGAQTVPGRFGWGVNLFSGSENTGNQITDNEVVGNHWGILVNNTAGNSGNIIRNNRIRDNARAGVATLVLASGNTIEGNDARGNGLLNLAPSLLFDLFDAPPLNNTWRDNQGTSNLAAASPTMASFDDRILAEAFSAGGCLAPARFQ